MKNFVQLFNPKNYTKKKVNNKIYYQKKLFD